jgi:hypothetical protein
LGNISHEIGRTATPGELQEKIKGNAPLAEAYGRMAEHLAANHVDLTKTPATFGAPLTVDSGAERFTGENSAPANARLTRDYRTPFVVPQLA